MARLRPSYLLAVIVAVSLAAVRGTTDIEKELSKYQKLIGALTRQLMMQQLSAEESQRTSGDSGIKQVRNVHAGTRPWYTSTQVNSNSVNAIHDHSQNLLTVGMGEVAVVMNGVEFRTRHNDFGLHQPHKTVSKYHRTEPIAFPPVPPSVLAKGTVQEQVDEMKEYFKAWKSQSTQKRNYKPYFKPVLCYLEGSWTQTSDAIDEPFFSDRHFVDASTWWDLTEKIRFTSYTGAKSNNENYSFLPMKIMSLINNNTEPVFAQWNYRILCAPVEDIPLRYLRPIDDLSSRMRTGKSLEELALTRQARFYLYNYHPNRPDENRVCFHCYLDTVMEQIPGMDNYQGYLEDDAFGLEADHPNGGRLNTAYYHRAYRSSRLGAMGLAARVRGYSDSGLYMAQTTHTKVPSLKVTDCVNGVCTDYAQRWTYAIPLEVIYLTPLSEWNPYNISYATNRQDPKFNAVTANGRNGGFTPEKAYNNSRNNIYYRTPEELFMGSGEVEKDPADTSKGVVGVLDPTGQVHRVVASGTRIFLPDIPDVGIIRIRYPISPLVNDGSPIYKELEALKDIVMRMDTYQHMFREKPSGGSGSGGEGTDPVYKFHMAMSIRDPPGLHMHEVMIPRSEVEAMMLKDSKYQTETNKANGHSHTVVVRYDRAAVHPWVVTRCDWQTACWDEHPLFLELQN